MVMDLVDGGAVAAVERDGQGLTMTATLAWVQASCSSKKRPASILRLRISLYSGLTPSSMVFLVMPLPTLTLSWVSSMGEL